MGEDVLTVEEAAAFLRATPEFVTEMLCAGEIQGRLISGEWRTTKRALASFVDGAPLGAVCCSTDSCCSPFDPAACEPGRNGGRRCC